MVSLSKVFWYPEQNKPNKNSILVRTNTKMDRCLQEVTEDEKDVLYEGAYL